MCADLAVLTRNHVKGLDGFFGSLGELYGVALHRVGKSGADEYVVEFSKGKFQLDATLDEDGRFEMINLR